MWHISRKVTRIRVPMPKYSATDAILPLTAIVRYTMKDRLEGGRSAPKLIWWKRVKKRSVMVSITASCVRVTRAVVLAPSIITTVEYAGDTLHECAAVCVYALIACETSTYMRLLRYRSSHRTADSDVIRGNH
jgi:hypothetical protein